MDYQGRVLIIDDDEAICKVWQAVLTNAGFYVDYVPDLERAYDRLKQVTVDLVLLDLNLGCESGLDGIPKIISIAPFAKLFILTANASVDTAVDAIKSGATDYISKDEPHSQVIEKIKSTLDLDRSNREHEHKNFADVGLIGAGESYHELCEMINQLKDVDSTILINGESGTGKEVVARSIHHLSNRSNSRFEAINCAAIPEALLESELFGHKKGAFTDAKSDRKGIFELCSDGTLLLDEIGDMPLVLQTKLLRVLQEREVVPVGGSQAVKVNTRVLAATHRDLKEEIKNGNFREDLYFRLSVLPIVVQPLRNRREEIPILVDFFLKDFCKKFNRQIDSPSAEVMKRVMSHDWPGNIRELKNAVERGVVLSQNGELSVKNMFQHLYMTKKSRDADENDKSSVNGQLFELPLTEAKQVFEKAYMENLLTKERGNIAAVSRLSGRYRVDIYRILEKYGIDHQPYRNDK